MERRGGGGLFEQTVILVFIIVNWRQILIRHALVKYDSIQYSFFLKNIYKKLVGLASDTKAFKRYFFFSKPVIPMLDTSLLLLFF